MHSGLVVEKISGTWKWKQVAVSDDGKALLALNSQEGLPSLWLWTSNSFTSNNVAELLQGPTQVADRQCSIELPVVVGCEVPVVSHP